MADFLSGGPWGGSTAASWEPFVAGTLQHSSDAGASHAGVYKTQNYSALEEQLRRRLQEARGNLEKAELTSQSRPALSEAIIVVQEAFAQAVLFVTVSVLSP
ncbi:hypothetical protein cyc_06458 [Cyclospora cayetanensis]|uniref:Uncharacterized protein n=1 Tax=Cyclospora cayetanensis TaxID=88456 RepID=A0A1D3D5N1_9EIME|nr:hypothetical protein cyc_06458 [Cyclospora cayetanensis]